MSHRAAAPAVGCALLIAALAGCAGADPPPPAIDDVHRLADTFGADFAVTSLGPSGIDPRLLAPQEVPADTLVEPAGCAEVLTTAPLPVGLEGNMAAVTAEGEGQRFVVIAVQTSAPVPVGEPTPDCSRVGYQGGAARGLVQASPVPTIDGTQTRGIHRVVQTAAGTGEIYTYLAGFDTFLVIVTANPLVVDGQAPVPVDTDRAGELLTAAVTAIRG